MPIELPSHGYPMRILWEFYGMGDPMGDYLTGYSLLGHGRPTGTLTNPWKAHESPMGDPMSKHMGGRWNSHGRPVEDPCETHGRSVRVSWETREKYVGDPWETHGRPMHPRETHV